MGGGWRGVSGRGRTHSWLRNRMCRGEDDSEAHREQGDVWGARVQQVE